MRYAVEAVQHEGDLKVEGHKGSRAWMDHVCSRRCECPGRLPWKSVCPLDEGIRW